MYAGKATESDHSKDIFYAPETLPYTRALLESLPQVDADRSENLCLFRAHRRI